MAIYNAPIPHSNSDIATLYVYTSILELPSYDPECIACLAFMQCIFTGFQIEWQVSARYDTSISPTGTFPLLIHDGFAISGYDSIRDYILNVFILSIPPKQSSTLYLSTEDASAIALIAYLRHHGTTLLDLKFNLNPELYRLNLPHLFNRRTHSVKRKITQILYTKAQIETHTQRAKLSGFTPSSLLDNISDDSPNDIKSHTSDTSHSYYHRIYSRFNSTRNVIDQVILSPGFQSFRYERWLHKLLSEIKTVQPDLLIFSSQANSDDESPIVTSTSEWSNSSVYNLAMYCASAGYLWPILSGTSPKLSLPESCHRYRQLWQYFRKLYFNFFNRDSIFSPPTPILLPDISSLPWFTPSRGSENLESESLSAIVWRSLLRILSSSPLPLPLSCKVHIVTKDEMLRPDTLLIPCHPSLKCRLRLTGLTLLSILTSGIITLIPVIGLFYYHRSRRFINPSFLFGTSNVFCHIFHAIPRAPSINSLPGLLTTWKPDATDFFNL